MFENKVENKFDRTKSRMLILHLNKILFPEVFTKQLDECTIRFDNFIKLIKSHINISVTVYNTAQLHGIAFSGI